MSDEVGSVGLLEDDGADSSGKEARMLERVLQLSNVSKSFSGVCVLKEVDLELCAGQVHCLVGENGAGKSTLIKIISGAYQPDADSRIIYLGEKLESLDPHSAMERGISTIYQEIDILPDLSVYQNVTLGHEPLRRSGNIDLQACRRRTRELLKEIDADHIDVNSRAGSLSLAQQQMVAIAKALLFKSRVLILDEPTAVFTASEVETLFHIIRRLKASGIAILYISHHLEEVFQIGDWLTILKDGVVTASGEMGNFDHDSVVRLMVGRDINFANRDFVPLDQGTVLDVDGLTDGHHFHDVKLEVRGGEIVAIAGLVGSGRTEVVRAIAGADRPQGGTVRLNGRVLSFKSPHSALKRGIGILPEGRKEEGIFRTRSVMENAIFSSVVIHSKAAFVPWRSIRALASGIFDMLQVRCLSKEMDIRFLSGGNQQKVVISKLLAAKCGVLILDEPTRGVDVGARSEIYKALHELKRQGKAILIVSSDITEVLSQADRILVMAKGRIVGELGHAEATEEKILKLALQVKEPADVG